MIIPRFIVIESKKSGIYITKVRYLYKKSQVFILKKSVIYIKKVSYLYKKSQKFWSLKLM